jgi:hypothetical protein
MHPENDLTNLVALNSQTHRDMRIEAARASRELAGVNIVSVVPREFGRLLAHYPIFFTRSADGEPFEPAALLGFAPGENLFLSGHAWDAAYIPLQIQRQPFALMPRPGTGPRGAPNSLDVAVDLNSPYVRRDGEGPGERLFEDGGQSTSFLQKVSSMLSALVSGSQEAFAYTARLVELNLLEPVRLDIEFADRSTTKLEGLYWIAAATLKQLPPETLAELRDRDFLEWTYFQMGSLTQMPGLVERKNRRLAARVASAANPSPPGGD